VTVAKAYNTQKNWWQTVWFSCLLQHPARKWIRPMVWWSEPTRGTEYAENWNV